MSKHHQVVSVTDSWYETSKIFSEHFLKFLFVTTIPLIITYIFTWSTVGSFVFSIKTIANPLDIISAQSGFVYFAIIALVIIIISQIWGGVALLVTTVNHKNIKLADVFTKSLEYFWVFVLWGLLIGCITIVGMIASFLVVAILGAILGLFSLNVLNDYFISLNIIPTAFTAIISALLIFSPYFLIDKKNNPWEAVKNSYHLVKQYFWPVALRIVIAYAIVYTIIFILSFVPYVGDSIALLLSAPVLSIYVYVLYKNLISIKK